MKRNNLIKRVLLASSLIFALQAGLAKPGVKEIIKDAQPDYVKCYGIAVAGKNEGSALEHGGPAKVQQEGACYAWIMMPRGLCKKIAHASVEKPVKGCRLPDGSLAQ